jgi:hypothetical protein
MVLNDHNVSKEVRKARGKGLEACGQIFEKAERREGENIPKQQLELQTVAFHAMLDTVWRQEMNARAGRFRDDDE